MAAEELSQVYLKLKKMDTRHAKPDSISKPNSAVGQKSIFFGNPSDCTAYMQQVDLIKDSVWLRACIQAGLPGSSIHRLKPRPSGRLHLEGERLARLQIRW